MIPNEQSLTIFWFRRDLRLEDNHGLYQAVANNKRVLPIFIFDRNILDKLEDKNDRRVNFIHDTISGLHQQLVKKGSTLEVFNSTPVKAFEELISKYKIDAVYTNHDYEPQALERDEEIKNYLAKHKIDFFTYKDQVIFEKKDITKDDGTPYTIFTPYSKKWKEKLNNLGVNIFPSEKYLDRLYKTSASQLPLLEELGFIKIQYKVATTEISENIIVNYHQNRNLPSVNGTTGFSVHLRFGTISIRKLVSVAQKLNEQWLNELIWREFFMMILFNFPHVITRSFKSKYDHINWRNNETEFKKWTKGETGYPIVDAGMKQLNETGFMHNRVRMIVASFLTKDLLIDWRWGEAYFAQKLMDYELSANNGNWQWAAGCGCDAAPYFRIFNPTEQTKKFDPKLEYIKTWIPDFDVSLIPPIVDHDFARKRCLEIYKKAVY
jgi:deoxyribodipyrimidine photo-lyase